MVWVVGFAGGAGFDAGLDGIPDGAGDDGGAVVWDGEIAVVEDAYVEAVAEEGGVGVVGSGQVGGLMDGAVSGAIRAHLEGKADAVDEGGVWLPAVADVGGAVTARGEGNRNADEADGGVAGEGAVGLDVVGEAAFDVDAEVIEEALVGEVNGSFDNAAFGAGGDGVVEGVEEVAAAAEIGAVVLSVVNITGPTGILPDDDACFWDAGLAEVGEEGAELVTTGGGGAGGGGIGEDAGEGEVVIGAVGLDGGELLGGGEVLFFAAAIAEVGGDQGARGEGTGGGGHFRVSSQRAQSSR